MEARRARTEFTEFDFDEFRSTLVQTAQELLLDEATLNDEAVLEQQIVELVNNINERLNEQGIIGANVLCDAGTMRPHYENEIFTNQKSDEPFTGQYVGVEVVYEQLRDEDGEFFGPLRPMLVHKVQIGSEFHTSPNVNIALELFATLPLDSEGIHIFGSDIQTTFSNRKWKICKENVADATEPFDVTYLQGLFKMMCSAGHNQELTQLNIDWFIDEVNRSLPQGEMVRVTAKEVMVYSPESETEGGYYTDCDQPFDGLCLGVGAMDVYEEIPDIAKGSELPGGDILQLALIIEVDPNNEKIIIQVPIHTVSKIKVIE